MVAFLMLSREYSWGERNYASMRITIAHRVQEVEDFCTVMVPKAEEIN
jgi:hypothetical protein